MKPKLPGALQLSVAIGSDTGSSCRQVASHPQSYPCVHDGTHRNQSLTDPAGATGRFVERRSITIDPLRKLSRPGGRAASRVRASRQAASCTHSERLRFWNCHEIRPLRWSRHPEDRGFQREPYRRRRSCSRTFGSVLWVRPGEERLRPGVLHVKCDCKQHCESTRRRRHLQDSRRVRTTIGKPSATELLQSDASRSPSEFLHRPREAQTQR